MNARAHWDAVYQAKAPHSLSWYCAHLKMSLDLIERAAPGRETSIIDVGGGESTLADDLIARGYQSVTVLDISATALEVTKGRLGRDAAQARWDHAGCAEGRVEPHSYDVWHDRAVFHFLTAEEDRSAYVRQALRAVRPGGHVIVSTFGPDGPQKCSGLDVVR